MKVVIALRSCPNYSDLSESNFAEQLDHPYKPKVELNVFIANNILDLWKKSFAMSYIEYRKRLCEIARENIKSTGCEILHWYEEFIRWYSKDPEDAIIVPVDDDDFFFPDLQKLESYYKHNTSCTYWNNSTLHSITKFHYGFSDNPYFASNTFSIRKSYLKTLDDKQARFLVLLSHRHTSKFIKSNVPADCRLSLDEHFSMYNRHAASLHFIRNQIDKNDFNTELPKIAKRDVVYAEPPENIIWSKPYVKKLFRLNQQLRGNLSLI